MSSQHPPGPNCIGLPIPVLVHPRPKTLQDPWRRVKTCQNVNNLHVIDCISDIRDINLSICVWNDHSVHNKSTMLLEYVLDHNIDAILTTETWLYDDDHVVIGECTPVVILF